MEPAAVMRAIDQDARDLDSAGKHLAKKIREQAQAESDYRRLIQKELIRIFDEARSNREKAPGDAALREAMAHEKVLASKDGAKAYWDHLTTTAEVEALKAGIQAKRASVSARQSLLSALRAEAVIT